uniref:Uncharacterized protein n=1 Tax=Cucumis melo TaxID=3656 RepID=A0A9I9DU49_CUCME
MAMLVVANSRYDGGDSWNGCAELVGERESKQHSQKRNSHDRKSATAYYGVTKVEATIKGGGRGF